MRTSYPPGDAAASTTVIDRPARPEVLNGPSSGSAPRRGRRRIVLIVTGLTVLAIGVPVAVFATVDRTGSRPSLVAIAPSRSPQPTPAATAGPSPGPSSSPPPTIRRYQAVRLGVRGSARAINDRGDVVGVIDATSGPRHPFLWRNGKVTDLGQIEPTFDGSGEAVDVNDRGQVVGYSTIGSKNPHIDRVAFIWQDGVMTALSTPGFDSVANAINDQGQVVGAYQADDGAHAFLWQEGVLTDLGAGGATGINDKGQIVGWRQIDPQTFVACIRSGGRVTDLPVVPGSSTNAEAINNAGWVIGHGRADSDEPGIMHGYLWRSGGVTDIGEIGAGMTEPGDINERGQIVGMTGLNNFAHPTPFLWQDGVMNDLTKRGLPTGAGATAINNRGQIAGNIRDNRDQSQAVIFTERP
jgi:probable HAF family extracellular repeat protein